MYRPTYSVAGAYDGVVVSATLPGSLPQGACTFCQSVIVNTASDIFFNDVCVRPETDKPILQKPCRFLRR